jgi:3-hydroxyacyl-CoA dehydrogenase
MGAQIAAHLVNAGVPTLLFDLPAKDGDKNGIVTRAIQNLAKLSPAPLADKTRALAITPANYDDHLDHLRDCDLVIEAIAERMDLKLALYKRIDPYLYDYAVIASNTSGLSIHALAQALPPRLRPRFSGIHFFNPPRYMHLVELIPGQETDRAVLTGLEAFLTTTLGKGVVYARDTPNFIGNRIGIFSLLATMHHTQAFGLEFDLVDALTGPAIGRPKSATYRTADVVGLDTLAHVVETMADTLSNDPWHAYFQSPAWLSALIAKGSFGQKTGTGVYTKRGKDILVLDLSKQDYAASNAKPSDEVAAILAIKNPVERFDKLRASNDPQAQFLWAIFRDLFHYSAYHLAEIAQTARDVDLAIRWGYGWKLGPFETWQTAGWTQIATWIAQDIAAGKAMRTVPLPDWVSKVDGVHHAHGSYSPRSGKDEPRSAHPVYQRQLFPDALIGEKFDTGTTLWENAGIRLWLLGDDDVGILSFKTKMNTVNDVVLDGIQHAIDYAERNLKALVIWQTGEAFSAGADLKSILSFARAGEMDRLHRMIWNFQQTSMRIKYSLVPVVAAMRGLVLGGGCEFQMHCARTVAALESYIGLVEAGVGLLPAGGGLKEIVVRAAQQAADGDVFPQIKRLFEVVAQAKLSGNALEAKRLGLLHEDAVIVFNSFELLHVAKKVAAAMAESGYRPPLPANDITVAGDVGAATLKMMLVNLREGRFISEHDEHIASRVADTLCGGAVERGSQVDEAWLLALELKHFFELVQMPKTQERIQHMLTTGKPLRN